MNHSSLSKSASTLSTFRFLLKVQKIIQAALYYLSFFSSYVFFYVREQIFCLRYRKDLSNTGLCSFAIYFEALKICDSQRAVFCLVK